MFLLFPAVVVDKLRYWKWNVASSVLWHLFCFLNGFFCQSLTQTTYLELCQHDCAKQAAEWFCTTQSFHLPTQPSVLRSHYPCQVSERRRNWSHGLATWCISSAQLIDTEDIISPRNLKCGAVQLENGISLTGENFNLPWNIKSPKEYWYQVHNNKKCLGSVCAFASSFSFITL